MCKRAPKEKFEKSNVAYISSTATKTVRFLEMKKRKES
jgi:hypothetical protein